MIHIESRKSKRYNSEYEIFVSLECNGGDSMPNLVKSLKRQLSYIRIDSDCSKFSPLNTGEEKLPDDVFDETSHSTVNQAQLTSTENDAMIEIMRKSTR